MSKRHVHCCKQHFCMIVYCSITKGEILEMFLEPGKIKNYNCQLPYDTYLLLRMMSIKEAKHMNKIIAELIEKKRKKYTVQPQP
jgi:hypothetical protein